MAKLTIEQPHRLSVADVRTSIEGLTKELADRYDVRGSWSSETEAKLGGPGLTGTLRIKPELIVVSLDLSFALSLIKGMIAAGIREELQRLFSGEERPAPAPAPPPEVVPLWQIGFYVEQAEIRALIRSTIELAAYEALLPLNRHPVAIRDRAVREIGQRVTEALFLMIADGPDIVPGSPPLQVAARYLDRVKPEPIVEDALALQSEVDAQEPAPAPPEQIPPSTVVGWLERAKEARDDGEPTDWHSALCSLAESMQEALGRGPRGKVWPAPPEAPPAEAPSAPAPPPLSEVEASRAAAGDMSAPPEAHPVEAAPLTPEPALPDTRARLAIGEKMELLLEQDRAEFLRRYDRIVAPGDTPFLSENQRIDQAAAAYRRWRTLALQPQVEAQELAGASLAWTSARDAFEQSTPAAAQLQAATERIDADLAEERRRPLLHPHQLPGAIPVPEESR